MTTKVFKLTLVRHGETAHNRQRLLQGQIDTQLSERGREQARLLGKYLDQAGVSFDRVYSSDLSRALETCQLITRNLMPITHSTQLRERHCGPLEGLPLDEARQLRQAYNNNNNNNKNNNNHRHSENIISSSSNNYLTSHPYGYKHLQYPRQQQVVDISQEQQQQQQQQQQLPDGQTSETSADVRARVRLFCEQILFPAVRHRHHVLVVSHAGCIRELMNLFKYSYNANLKSAHVETLTPNTALNVFDILLTKNDSKPLKIIPLHLHQLPHLTFDVYNRDNPHPRLQNIRSITSTRAFNIVGAHAHYYMPPTSNTSPLTTQQQQVAPINSSANNNNNNNKNKNKNTNKNKNNIINITNNGVVVENYKQWDEINYKDGGNFDSSSEELNKNEVRSIFSLIDHKQAAIVSQSSSQPTSSSPPATESVTNCP